VLSLLVGFQEVYPTSWFLLGWIFQAFPELQITWYIVNDEHSRMNKQNLMVIIIAVTAQVYYLLLLYGGTEKKTVFHELQNVAKLLFFRK